MQNQKAELCPAGKDSPAPKRDLAQSWALLLAASKTDSRARQFVEYFRADAARLFGGGASSR